MNKRKTKVSDDQINELEAHLAGTLKPVPLSRDVVQRLRERMHMPFREGIALRLNDWKKMFLVFGGVMSGLVVLITIARAFFYLLGRKNMM